MLNKIARVLLAAALVSPAVASDDDMISLNIRVKAGSSLGKLIQGVNKGVYKLHPDKLHLALTDGYQPADDETSVGDLFNTHYARGDVDRFFQEMKILSDRGNPVAWGFYGWSLANGNFATKNADYQQGLELMKKATAAQVSSACVLLDEAMLTLIASPPLDPLAYIAPLKANPRNYTNGALAFKVSGNGNWACQGCQWGAEAGDPSGAGEWALFEFNQTDLQSGLMWALISYHGSTSMDWFGGLEPLLQSIAACNFKPAQIQKAQQGAAAWLKDHPQIFMDGFDLIRMATQSPSTTKQVEQLMVPTTVQGLFWQYYAVGEKNGFAAALEPLVDKEDANALYMKAFLSRGFVGAPDPVERRTCLEQAVEKNHPLAYLDLALDFWIEGILSSGQDRQQRYKKAADLLTQGYKKWFGQHNEAIGELIFFLGYFNEFGIGFDAPNPRTASTYYTQAFYLTPLVAGHLGCQMDDQSDPIKRCVYLTISKPSLTNGDWFSGGLMHWYNSVVALNAQDYAKAMLMVKDLQSKGEGLTWNFYQRIAAGLDPAFSGL